MFLFPVWGCARFCKPANQISLNFFDNIIIILARLQLSLFEGITNYCKTKSSFVNMSLIENASLTIRQKAVRLWKCITDKVIKYLYAHQSYRVHNSNSNNHYITKLCICLLPNWPISESDWHPHDCREGPSIEVVQWHVQTGPLSALGDTGGCLGWQP